MKKIVPLIIILLLSTSLTFAQDASLLIYKGDFAEGMITWPWGYLEDPVPVRDTGYTPGSSALRWVTYDGGGFQGVLIYFESNVGVDLSSIWETESVYFKLKAPNGLAESEALFVYIYDSRNADWDYTVYHEVTNFHDIDDGNWHQFSIPLSEFLVYVNDIDPTDIVGLSFEASESGIISEMHIDDVWIGDPEINIDLMLFDGYVLTPGVSFGAWGFSNNNLVISQGEGYTPDSNAIVWETSNWNWQGMSFTFEPQDFTDSWSADSFKVKIKAPPGINDLALVWYDWNDYTATKLLDESVVIWDDTWKSLEIPLVDFETVEDFDVSTIYSIQIEAAEENLTIPERLLITDIWNGNPTIYAPDDEAPPPPDNVSAYVDPSYDYINFIAWDDVASESGETYTVYASLIPISDITGPGVFEMAIDIAEGENLALHRIYYPLADGEVTYFYAVTCTDAAGNISETFSAAAEPLTNVGKERAIISLNPADFDFAADGEFYEWDDAGIAPYTLDPDHNLYTGTIDGPLDYSAFCYVAMDDENLYVAFDVIDDVFSWRPENTMSWWDDENIEFYFGLYEFVHLHPGFSRGEEPDHRLVFLPDELLWFSGDALDLGPGNYYFEPLGASDYVVEAKIPFELIRQDEDVPFTPEQGMAIPFEIFAADADVIDGGNESRLQLGDNPALNPWGAGQEVWTFAWVGMPDMHPDSIEEDLPIAAKKDYLGYNYPNPFNPATTIEYAISQDGQVGLDVYNSAGQRVAVLVDKHQP
ncbi:MAG: hypothetical protein GY839_12285, partial [candidate division Zixibacteria bacterium]|nr:hypothetical protein [candidate division Zixibacteria bacterium]